MKRKSIVYLLISLLLVNIQTILAQNTCTLSGDVRDAKTKELLEFANVRLMKDGHMVYGTITDAKGHFQMTQITPDTYQLIISFLGYDDDEQTVDLHTNSRLDILLHSSATSLNEVIVTASESKEATSSSKIDRNAMKHLQPSSFSDLMELVPGGKSVDPAMGAPNLIRLREAGSTSEDISSLGVSFVVDGVTQNNDANLQYIPGTTKGVGKSSVSKGVDMRTLPTDNIESVEIVRGIPSVAYGNITGGTVIIQRKSSESPFSARFKADQTSMLFSAGKGFRLDDNGQHILNADISYLDSKIDPRDNSQNYKRMTGSLRWDNRYQWDDKFIRWNVSADYTGSLDATKRDKDATAKEDAFKASYHSASLAGKWKLTFPSHSAIREVNAGASLRRQWDRMEETRSVVLSRPTAIPISTEQGDADGIYLPFSYIGNMVVDGKPFYANLHANARFRFRHDDFSHDLQAGLEWDYQKNFGEGQLYDPYRPLNYSTTVRPRSYNDIPAMQPLALYAEETVKFPLERHRFSITAGVRLQTLLGLSQAYSLQGKVYADPRLNIQWKLPESKDWGILFSGGWGLLSRMPTSAQLFPDAKYIDITELNYYSTNPDFRRIHLMTHKWDNTNYRLEAARNMKWEVRFDVSYKENRLAVTYFRERMNNAFRDITYYKVLPYRKYDATSIDPSKLNGPPELSQLAWTQETLLDAYSMAGNGTKVNKEGIEFQFSSKRIDLLKTRITINGAWFKTLYSNNMPTYSSEPIILNNKQYSYVGLYDWEDGTEYQSFRTNFMFDTYLQRLGLTLSTSAQCTWLTSTRNLWNNGTPVSYIDATGAEHPFLESDKEDAYLQHLVKRYAADYFNVVTVPFAMDINLKATKDIGKHINLALFVNRLLSVYPDYRRGEQLIRRSSTPYFGMELNLKF